VQLELLLALVVGHELERRAHRHLVGTEHPRAALRRLVQLEPVGPAQQLHARLVERQEQRAVPVVLGVLHELRGRRAGDRGHDERRAVRGLGHRRHPAPAGERLDPAAHVVAEHEPRELGEELEQDGPEAAVGGHEPAPLLPVEPPPRQTLESVVQPLVEGEREREPVAAAVIDQGDVRVGSQAD
jgi:hypothetical protein